MPVNRGSLEGTSDRTTNGSKMEYLLTVDDLKEMFKVPSSWVYGRIHRGDLPFPYLKVGRYVRFRASDVEAYLESVTKLPNDESTVG